MCKGNFKEERGALL